jgi:hypothetical protein
VWKDNRNVNLLTNMHHSPAEGNFCDECGNPLKRAIIQDCNKHKGYVDKSNYMTNTPSADGPGSAPKKKKKFLYILDLILNSYILLTSCGSK